MTTSVGPSVLVIDDDADVREMLTDFLGAHGYSVRAAADAASGLAQISQVSPEIVLVDIAMPGLSGVDALPRILALAPRVAVVMVSGAGDDDIAVRTRALGAVDYLVKPFDFSRLHETLAMALERRKSDLRPPR